jgi:hypothetical protein
MSEKAVDVTKIPVEELIKDLDGTVEDIAVCRVALAYGLTTYSGGSVQDRLDDNLKIRDIITAELSRRAGINSPCQRQPIS